MILRVNEWLFVNSTEERTKQVGTLRLNRPYSVTKKNDGIELGKRTRNTSSKKERDEKQNKKAMKALAQQSVMQRHGLPARET